MDRIERNDDDDDDDRCDLLPLSLEGWCGLLPDDGVAWFPFRRNMVEVHG
jgi:hypothetical protein